jgi:hypothetical protein
MSKRELPHTSVITFDIDIRPINPDNSLGESLSDERLLRYNLGKKAQINILGVSEADCIQNIKNKLEKLNESLGE